MTLITISNQWDDYIQGWQILINTGDVITWNLLLLVAFTVRAIAFIVLLVSLGERLYYERPTATRRAILSVIVLLLVTLPFFFAGQPLIYPSFKDFNSN